MKVAKEKNIKKEYCDCSGDIVFKECKHKELARIIVQKIKDLKDTLGEAMDDLEVLDLEKPIFDTFQITTDFFIDLTEKLKSSLELIEGEDYKSSRLIENQEQKKKGALIPLLNKIFKNHKK